MNEIVSLDSNGKYLAETRHVVMLMQSYGVNGSQQKVISADSNSNTIDLSCIDSVALGSEIISATLNHRRAHCEKQYQLSRTVTNNFSSVAL